MVQVLGVRSMRFSTLLQYCMYDRIYIVLLLFVKIQLILLWTCCCIHLTTGFTFDHTRTPTSRTKNIVSLQQRYNSNHNTRQPTRWNTRISNPSIVLSPTTIVTKKRMMNNILYSSSIVDDEADESQTVTSTTTTRTTTNVQFDNNDTQPNIKENSTTGYKYTKCIQFPPYKELMVCRYGNYIVSDTFTVQVGTAMSTAALTTTTTTNKNIPNEFDFCIKFYPRGGGHLSLSSVITKNSGFGMVYEMESSKSFLDDLLQNNKNQNEKVGVYLQYVPRPGTEQYAIDISFGLTLIGKQQQQKRFNVEFRAGMRFVPLEQSQLINGQANDFGTHLMQTPLLQSFLGCDYDEYDDYGNDDGNHEQPTELQVDLLIHQIIDTTTKSSNENNNNNNLFEQIKGSLKLEDIRTIGYQPSPTENVDSSTTKTTMNSIGTSSSSLRGSSSSSSSSSNIDFVHNPDEVRVGRIVVPIIQSLKDRPRMFQAGVYPGVEYRILRIIDPFTNEDLFYSRPNADYELKPIYPLVAQLERQWPVRINEKSIPRLYTSTMYNIISAVGSLFTAFSGLLVAFIVSQAVSFYYIPSRSMEPTLNIGDVLLVDKVTPRVQQQLLSLGVPLFGNGLRTGEVVLFNPPEQLRTIVEQAGGRVNDRDLFVKRIAGQPGETFTVTPDGNVKMNDNTIELSTLERRDLCTAEPLKLLKKYYLRPTDTTITIQPGTVAVLGDCSDVSIDSRIWGTLPTQNIIGKPILRLWPLSQFGRVPPLPTTIIEQTTTTTTTTVTTDPDLWKN